jgi:hypothetical protein
MYLRRWKCFTVSEELNSKFAPQRQAAQLNVKSCVKSAVLNSISMETWGFGLHQTERHPTSGVRFRASTGIHHLQHVCSGSQALVDDLWNQWQECCDDI